MSQGRAKRLLLAAGGTGGHMFPAQALSENLKSEGWDIAMMTDARGYKHAGRILADPIIQVQAATLSPRHPVRAAIGVFKLTQGTRRAKAFIRSWQPDVVVGFGGYPAFPAMRAAQTLNVPTLIHEQNAVLGRVNRLFARKSLYLASGFEILEKCPPEANHICTGNPLRSQILKAVPRQYNVPDSQINILIMGGSLGARLLSVGLPEAIAVLPEGLRARLNVVQQTRQDHLETARRIYKDAGVNAICEPFFSDIDVHLGAAHYVVGRAGAGSVSEIAVMGKPSLLVPLAIAMDDHQMENAKSLSRLNAADILPESEFTSETVKTTLERRLNDSTWLEHAAASARQAGRPNAAKNLAALVMAAAR